MNTFGERLRFLRNERNLHQSELGDLLELSPSAIGSYERNLREPSYNHLVKFADLFGVSTDYLLCRTSERLTVADYIKQDSISLSALLHDHTVTMGGQVLSDKDKSRIHDIAFTLLRLGHSGDLGD